MDTVLTHIAVAAVILCAVPVSSSRCQAQSQSPPLRPSETGVYEAQHVQSNVPEKCKALYGDHGTIRDAPTNVTEISEVDAMGQIPAYCYVRGVIAPTVHFELRLPDNWNGKLAEYGGYHGVTVATCDDLLHRGYACLNTDQGAIDASHMVWALNDIRSEIDFGMASQHVGVLAGKALTKLYYGRDIAHAYMIGCSQGGRQGMMEAQRFPADFDGIIAGAPGRGDLMSVFWAAMALSDANGKPIISTDDLALVNKAVIADCDMNDGLKDGIIGDPRACKFDPAELQCKGAKTPACLTKAQADAIRKVYTGAVTSTGLRVEPGGSAMKGSELSWPGELIDSPTRPGTYNTLAISMMRYVNFYPSAGPTWQPRDFDWDTDPQRMAVTRAINVATNPDLRPFKARGGKLISFKGWADELMPEAVTDYYELTERTMGGREATQAFYRLFMIPGMGHCGGGPGADIYDFLTALEDWVEKGKAPDMLVGSHLSERNRYLVWPPDPSKIAFQRPIYPYPLEARYQGGDPTRAASFGPVDSSAAR